MLKLTVSFCRSKVTCKNVSYRTHVRHFTQLNRDKVSSIEISSLQLTSQFSSHQPLASKKKKRITIPPFNSDEPNEPRKMGETFQPSYGGNVNYGGQFEVTTTERRSGEWPSFDYATGSANTSSDARHSSSVPYFRIWETVKKSDNCSAFKFKVVSYNVLAQCLLECHPYLYAACSPRNLKWKIRAERLYDEIISMAPDIICLQEVQASHLNSFYTRFEQIGYVGIYKQKTGHREDGCAIYYRRSLFKKIDHCSVEFYQPGLPILNRDNIGIMVKLVPRHMPRTQLVVATTHLLYNPKRTDIRLAQMQVMLAELDRFAYFSSGRDAGHLPIILTGDLNSTPDSAVIELLDQGHVSTNSFRDGSDWMRIGVTDNCQHLVVYIDRLQGRTTDFSTTKIYNSEYCSNLPSLECQVALPTRDYGAMFNSGMIGHFLNFTSVYAKTKPDGNFEASTYQDYWVTVDYIYFSRCSTLKLLERLRLPTMAECHDLGSLPNDVYGSDHLSLGAVFELKPINSSL